MIYDLTTCGRRYLGISPQLDAALQLLQNIEQLCTQAPGRYTLDDGIFYTVMDCELHPFPETKWECHREYIDIQYAMEEGERIAVRPVADIHTWGDYSSQNDVCFADDGQSGVILPMRKDTFAVFFPEDAHRPCWAENEKKQVRKLVIKIPV